MGRLLILLIQGDSAEESKSLLVDNGQYVGKMSSGINVDRKLIYLSLAEEQTRKQVDIMLRGC